MKTLFFVFLFLCLMFGCLSPASQIQQVSVTGVGIGQLIRNNGSVDIDVSGTNNVVRVANWTIVHSVTISGVNNVIFLPNGSAPLTSISGVNSRIEYY